ncbi:MAG: hypothetical protein H6R30_357, partial [Methanomicrobia archaeon]|nr:hypothetical protein [Methanomicrobia archaeon]
MRLPRPLLRFLLPLLILVAWAVASHLLANP